MASLVPGGVLPYVGNQYFDANGNPLAAGQLFTYVAGTSTPLPLYSDSALTTAAANPVILDAAGRLPQIPLFMLPTGYKFVLEDAANQVIWTADNVEDAGTAFAATFGTVLATGAKAVTSGYTILGTDNLVTVASSGGPNPCLVNLPSAPTYSGLLTVKNLGTIPLSVVPNGTDKIDTAASLTIPAASGTTLPSVLLVSDHVSAWWILAAYKVP